MILDVTAGNRVMWNKNRNPPNIIFIDKESDLHYPPDIVADNTNLPIRLGLKIDSIIFDPPWGVNLPPWFLNKKPIKTKSTWGKTNSYYGDFKSKREMFTYINKAQKEFQRYTRKLCFKWGERNVSVWKILPLFREWKIIQKKLHKTNMNIKSKTDNWWITMSRSEDHVCDSCPVTWGEGDASELCEGCPNEMELMNYVPKHLR